MMSARGASVEGLKNCSQEVAETFRNGGNDGTRVEVTATVRPVERSLTRAADNLNVNATGFSDNSQKVCIKVDGRTSSSTFTPYEYGIGTDGKSLTAPATAPLFPAGVNSVNVYGWYPYNNGSTTFTIQDDQSGDAAYNQSDLMLASQKQSTRDASNNVTAAALDFQHVMAKAKVTVTPQTGVKVKSVKLKNVKKSVTINESSPESLSVTLVSSVEAGDVTLYSNASGSEAAVTSCGVFPAQSISGNLIEVVAEIGGASSTVTYQLESAKTFAEDTEYEMNITVSPTQTDSPTVTLGNWADGDDLTVTVGGGSASLQLSESSLSLKQGGQKGSLTISGSVTLNNGAGSFEVKSSDEAIAKVSVSGATITVDPVGVGNATITLSDKNNIDNKATCSVKVDEANGISLSEVTSSHVGYIVSSAGKLYANKTAVDEDQAVAQALIYNVPNNGHAQAVALFDAASDTWNNITNNGANKDVDVALGSGKLGDKGLQIAPSGATWKVLNMENYKAMWQALGIADTYNVTSNGKITAAGGSALSGGYWSTQEVSSGYGWGFGDNGWHGSYLNKGGSYAVRPVLAW